MTDQIDVDCASCGYSIRDFSNVVAVACGHGLIHYNCAYFNLDCAVCNEKLIPDTDDTQFRPRNFIVEENLKAQLDGINEGITDLKNLIVEQKEEQSKTSRLVEVLSNGIKSRDEQINELQKEVYELKLEKLENLKKDLLEKMDEKLEKVESLKKELKEKLNVLPS